MINLWTWKITSRICTEIKNSIESKWKTPCMNRSRRRIIRDLCFLSLIRKRTTTFNRKCSKSNCKICKTKSEAWSLSDLSIIVGFLPSTCSIMVNHHANAAISKMVICHIKKIGYQNEFSRHHKRRDCCANSVYTVTQYTSAFYSRITAYYSGTSSWRTSYKNTWPKVTKKSNRWTIPLCKC